MSDTVVIPRDEYDFLRSKAKLFDKYIENGELSKSELAMIKKALKGPFLTKGAFLKKHPGLA